MLQPERLRLSFGMNWQQAVSIGIVTLTAVLFWRGRFGSRKFQFSRQTHCGCGSGRKGAAPAGVIYRARKGQRPQIILKQAPPANLA
jgi:hypothetical protein